MSGTPDIRPVGEPRPQEAVNTTTEQIVRLHSEKTLSLKKKVPKTRRHQHKMGLQVKLSQHLVDINASTFSSHAFAATTKRKYFRF